MNRLLIGSADKTALLLQMMQEDFASGFTLIDPTGVLAEAVADRAPVQRTCYLDPSDLAHPPGFNVLDGVLRDDRHRVAEDIRAFFDAMFPEGPETLARARSNYILLNCLRLLLDTPGTTFFSLPKLLTDTAYRTHCKGHCIDPVVLAFWNDEFEKWDERYRKDAIVPLQGKLGDLLTSPIIRNILGQKHSTFSLEGGNIVIANLDRAKLGDRAAFLLGSLLISRAKGAVYLNDLGFYGSNHLSSLLAQDRTTVACQYLQELPVKLRTAVLGIEDKFVFRTIRNDAEALAFYVGVDNPSILMAPILSPWEARTADGVITPTAPPSARRLKANRKRSRARHTRPRRMVEKSIARFLNNSPSQLGYRTS